MYRWILNVAWLAMYLVALGVNWTEASQSVQVNTLIQASNPQAPEQSRLATSDSRPQQLVETVTATPSRNESSLVYLPLIWQSTSVDDSPPTPTTTPTEPVPTTTPTEPVPTTTPTEPVPTTTPTEPVPTTVPVVLGEYFGSATMKVWYKETMYNPPQLKTYQSDVRVNVDWPLIGNDGSIENNPFNYDVSSLINGGFGIGTFTIASAGIYNTDAGYVHINQYWTYSKEGEEYSGSFEPLLIEGPNTLIVEDIVFNYICFAQIKRGSDIAISFNEDNMVTQVTGTVHPDSYTPCAQYIERFEIIIDATR
jgi:hypothetical protein